MAWWSNLVKAGNIDLEQLTKQLDAGADLHKTAPHKEGDTTLLHIASAMGDSPAVACLLERGAAVTVFDGDNRSPLSLAASKGQEEVVHLLIDKCPARQLRILLGIRDHNDWTAIHHAVTGGVEKIVIALLDAGADPDVKDKQNNLPLHIACARGDVGAIRHLLAKSKACIDAVESSGKTPLIIASSEGHTEVCEALCDEGAAMDIADQDGDTAAYWAAAMEHAAVFHCLDQRGADTS